MLIPYGCIAGVLQVLAHDKFGLIMTNYQVGVLIGVHDVDLLK